MKKITAYIKPFKLETMLERLPATGISEVVVSECRGYGRQKERLERYKGDEYELTFLPKARVEIYCEDAIVVAIEKAIIEGSRTGRIGDGKIIIAQIERVYG